MNGIHAEKRISLLVLMALASTVIVGQMYTVLGLFEDLARSFGEPVTAMLWASTAFGLPYAVGSLISGPLSDRYGPRRVIVPGLLLTALATALVGMAPTYGSLIAARGIQGIGAAFLVPPLLSYVNESIPERSRPQFYTVIIGAAFSSAIIMQVGARMVADVQGWRAVFLLGSVLILGFSVLLWRSLAASTSPRGGSLADVFLSLPGFLTRPRFLAFYFAALTLLSGFVAIFTALVLAGPPGLAGHPERLLALKIMALPGMLAVPLASHWVGRIPSRVRMVGGLAASATAALGIALVGVGEGVGEGVGVGLVAGLLSVFAAGLLLASPALIQNIGMQARDRAGAATALYAFAVFLGASLGPQLAWAFRPLGFAGILGAVATLLFVGATAAFLASRPPREALKPVEAA
ncbi:MFS transporter [Rhodospirillum sp. A1_3_36]|uniref:MFS transporter n=1 Tax=Rhodospirillum sp. A1_3_36 TaxID=3391666 RepID=UPI0039A77950